MAAGSSSVEGSGRPLPPPPSEQAPAKKGVFKGHSVSNDKSSGNVSEAATPKENAEVRTDQQKGKIPDSSGSSGQKIDPKQVTKIDDDDEYVEVTKSMVKEANKGGVSVDKIIADDDASYAEDIASYIEVSREALTIMKNEKIPLDQAIAKDVKQKVKQGKADLKQVLLDKKQRLEQKKEAYGPVLDRIRGDAKSSFAPFARFVKDVGSKLSFRKVDSNARNACEKISQKLTENIQNASERAHLADQIKHKLIELASQGKINPSELQSMDAAQISKTIGGFIPNEIKMAVRELSIKSPGLYPSLLKDTKPLATEILKELQNIEWQINTKKADLAGASPRKAKSLEKEIADLENQKKFLVSPDETSEKFLVQGGNLSVRQKEISKELKDYASQNPSQSKMETEKDKNITRNELNKALFYEQLDQIKLGQNFYSEEYIKIAKTQDRLANKVKLSDTSKEEIRKLAESYIAHLPSGVKPLVRSQMINALEKALKIAIVQTAMQGVRSLTKETSAGEITEKDILRGLGDTEMKGLESKMKVYLKYNNPAMTSIIVKSTSLQKEAAKGKEANVAEAPAEAVQRGRIRKGRVEEAPKPAENIEPEENIEDEDFELPPTPEEEEIPPPPEEAPPEEAPDAGEWV